MNSNRTFLPSAKKQLHINVSHYAGVLMAARCSVGTRMGVFVFGLLVLVVANDCERRMRKMQNGASAGHILTITRQAQTRIHPSVYPLNSVLPSALQHSEIHLCGVAFL